MVTLQNSNSNAAAASGLVTSRSFWERIVLGCFVLGIAIYWTTASQSRSADNPSHAAESLKTKTKILTGASAKVTIQDIVPSLLKTMESARKDHLLLLQAQYGEFMEPIFFQPTNDDEPSPIRFSRGYEMFASAGFTRDGNRLSIERLHRRFQRKILQAISTKEDTFIIWATAGHSAAAGHGNYHNQSYTAVLEQALQPFFTKSSNIRFIGRNYAMGGMSSGAELAFCQSAVYGTDIDVLTWDFGMTDAGTEWKKLLFDIRRGYHPNQPVIVDLNVEHFQQDYTDLQNAGLTTLHMETENTTKHVLKNDVLPDMWGLTHEQMKKYPPHVRHFRCQEEIEKGDPTCDAEKYFIHNDTKNCDTFRQRTSWHPGWRVNALYGNLMALFVMDHAIEATMELLTNESTPVAEVQAQLEVQRQRDYERWQQTELFKHSGDTPNVARSLEREINKALFPILENMLHSTTGICRTALLPAQSRYKGIATGSSNVMKEETYQYEGVNEKEALRLQKKDSEDKEETMDMVLVQDKKEHYLQCPVQIVIDFKDYYFANENMGWTRLVVPNELEKKTYSASSTSCLGYIILCHPQCDWGKCPKEDMRGDDLETGGWEIKVNGKYDVKRAVLFGRNDGGCSVLRHGAKGDEGFRFVPEAHTSEDCKFDLQIRVNPPVNASSVPSYVRMSSIIVM